MIMNYVTQIRAKVSIYARKKSSNIFDGSYKSIYQGNGLDFENLREYIPGDSIRDIDWKASSRSGKVLVKRYIAEKKHNIMVVYDTGRKMCAHTKCLQIKKKLALYVGGVLSYLAAKNGDNVGALYNKNGKIQYFQLRTGLENIEEILTKYDREDFSFYNADLEKSLDYLIKNIRRRMIVFVISDAFGIKSVNETTLRKLSYQHDVFFIKIGDASLTEGEAFDVEKNAYIPDFITNNPKLISMEKEIREKIDVENEKKLLQHRIVSIEVDREEDIVEKVIELLGGHKNANNC